MTRLHDMIVTAAREAARKAAAETGGPVRQWGTVTAVSSDEITVTMDGGGSVVGQCVTKLPSVDDRVLVEFAGGSVLVVGIQGGFA